MKVICISGLARAGKDTLASMLKDELEKNGNRVLITHFADLLKFIAKEFFKWNGEKDSEGRRLLQYIGTDVIRKDKPDYWVDFIIEILKWFPEWDYVLIPDCRFPNECENFKENSFNTITIRVERPGFQSSLTEEQKRHPSETALDNYDFNYTVSSENMQGLLENAELLAELL